MSDEEKKAVVYLKSYCINDVLYDNKHYEQIETVLNLIEKQQKEREELKKQDLSNSKIIANMSERHFHDREKIRKYEVLQDKIKAKIEELEKLDFGTDLVSQFTANLTTITILQSLLEKE